MHHSDCAFSQLVTKTNDPACDYKGQEFANNCKIILRFIFNLSVDSALQKFQDFKRDCKVIYTE